MGRLGWLVGGGLLAVGASCALQGFNRVEALPVGGAGGAGGSSGAGGSDGGGGALGCEHASFPAPNPDVKDAGGALDIVLAVRKAYLTAAAFGGPLGLDLDKTCTCQGEGDSCLPAGGQPVCDQAGGRDNAVEPLFTVITLLVGQDASTFYSERAEEGGWSLLIRVQGYNGEADDDNVVVSMFVPPSFDPGDVGAVPAWDGSDAWPVSETSLAMPVSQGGSIDTPRYSDENAYVTGGKLVASLQNGEFQMAGGKSNIVFETTGSFLVADLTADGDRWRVQRGVFGGRISEPALFKAMSSFRDHNGKSLCTDSAIFLKAKPTLCEARDILASIGGPTSPCDSASYALGFDAESAQLGEVFPPPEPVPGCPSETDPINSSCE